MNIDEFENKLDTELAESIAFGEELKSLDTDLLKVGDYLTIKTRGGSRYVFKVLLKNNEGIKMKCFAGPKELLREEGNLINEELRFDGKLFFGEDLTDSFHTSGLKGIIVTQNAPDLSAKPVEYGKKLDSVETASLKVGDIVTIEIKSRTPFYAFEVIGIDEAVYSVENETIKYARIIVHVRLGKKEHQGRRVKLTNSFFQKDCILKGEYLLEDGGEPFKLRRRIKKILVTRGALETTKDETHSAVVNTVELATETPVEAPALQEPVIMTGLSEKQRIVLSNLGLNVDKGITKADLKNIWDEFERKFKDPKEKGELIDVFQDFFFKFPPPNIELDMLLKKIRFTLNQVLSKYF